jgi:hypothetical protein
VAAGGGDRSDARVDAEVLDENQRGKQPADLVGEVGVRGDVLVDRGLVASPPPLGELFRQTLELVSFAARGGFLGQRHGYSAMPGMRTKSSRSRRMART